MVNREDEVNLNKIFWTNKEKYYVMAIIMISFLLNFDYYYCEM